jgi:F0F1-type ATP synthase assembly protein I
MKHWRHATMDYGLEQWIPENALARRAGRILSEAILWVGMILVGMGIGWILQRLHAAGVTP